MNHTHANREQEPGVESHNPLPIGLIGGRARFADLDRQVMRRTEGGSRPWAAATGRAA